jgi:hypothetical protein
VIVDGVEAGVTPLEVTLPVGDGTVAMVLKKAGYRSETRTLDAASEDLSVTLTRITGTRGRSDAPPIVR